MPGDRGPRRRVTDDRGSRRRGAGRSEAAVVTGRRSEHALYAETLASYGAGETFPHEASEGFITISALEVELAAARERKLALT